MAFPGTDLLASPHIDSKIKMWKSHYNLIRDALNTNGFAWCEQEKKVKIDSEDVWRNYIQIYPKAKILQDMTFPFYEDWVVLFGKDRATGEGAEGLAEAVDREEAVGEGDDTNFTINIDDMDFSGNSSSGGGATSTPTSKGGKKRARASDLASMADSFTTLVEKAHTSMNEHSKRIGYAQDISQARKMCLLNL
ncbi:uncharacterized protein LOC130764001 [Actinidia eriantha]|uniref:uncharacterized protein LOC130764001 n=1 Tax=Actinidia eriantha TaxID=165200 RepID=UPI0025863D94|nr:uncharacterized protein LOC130764001 [Actinidia eriantha]